MSSTTKLRTPTKCNSRISRTSSTARQAALRVVAVTKVWTRNEEMQSRLRTSFFILRIKHVNRKSSPSPSWLNQWSRRVLYEKALRARKAASQRFKNPPPKPCRPPPKSRSARNSTSSSSRIPLWRWVLATPLSRACFRPNSWRNKAVGPCKTSRKVLSSLLTAAICRWRKMAV